MFFREACIKLYYVCFFPAYLIYQTDLSGICWAKCLSYLILLNGKREMLEQQKGLKKSSDSEVIFIDNVKIHHFCLFWDMSGLNYIVICAWLTSQTSNLQVLLGFVSLIIQYNLI